MTPRFLGEGGRKQGKRSDTSLEPQRCTKQQPYAADGAALQAERAQARKQTHLDMNLILKGMHVFHITFSSWLKPRKCLTAHCYKDHYTHNSFDPL